MRGLDCFIGSLGGPWPNTGVSSCELLMWILLSVSMGFVSLLGDEEFSTAIAGQLTF